MRGKCRNVLVPERVVTAKMDERSNLCVAPQQARGALGNGALLLVDPLRKGAMADQLSQSRIQKISSGEVV